ncbi:MAG: hypothetical protein P8014_11125 [Acidihalobacter sp.]|uniref:hypothetical protein n=1 Tax=Acidihalobacter sp. TaxID=1872108 RepID=UPI00307D0F0E
MFLVITGRVLFGELHYISQSSSSSVVSSRDVALQVDWKNSVSNDSRVGHASPQATVKRLLDARFVQDVLMAYKDAHPRSRVLISSEVPLGTNVVLLKCESAEGGGEVCRDLLKAIVKDFSDSNGRLPVDSRFRISMRIVDVKLHSLMLKVGRAKKYMIVVLSVFLGVVLSLMVVVLASFLGRVRQRISGG